MKNVMLVVLSFALSLALIGYSSAQEDVSVMDVTAQVVSVETVETVASVPVQITETTTTSVTVTSTACVPARGYCASVRTTVFRARQCQPVRTALSNVRANHQSRVSSRRACRAQRRSDRAAARLAACQARQACLAAKAAANCCQ